MPLAVPPLQLRLGGVAEIEGDLAEDLEPFLGSQPHTRLLDLHRLLGDLDQPLELGDLLGQQAVPGAQLVQGVGLGVLQDGGDLVEGEAEFPVEEDLLEPGEVGVTVEAVAGRAAVARGEQARLVVVVQGTHRDPCEAGDLSDRVAHRSALPSRTARGPMSPPSIRVRPDVG